MIVRANSGGMLDVATIPAHDIPTHDKETVMQRTEPALRSRRDLRSLLSAIEADLPADDGRQLDQYAGSGPRIEIERFGRMQDQTHSLLAFSWICWAVPPAESAFSGLRPAA